MEKCKIDGCEKPIIARGYCNRHYRKLMLYGDPTFNKRAKKKCKIEGCERIGSSFEMCNMHYKRYYKYGDPFIKKGKWKTDIDFIVNENGCFICTSHKPSGPGYPMIQRQKERICLHRHIYVECFGEIPEGMVIRHKCDNRMCINPEHLEIGTQSQNVGDTVERDRQARGTMLPHAKLNDEKVRIIKRRLENGEQNSILAEEFDISRTVISNIKTHKTWKHVKVSGFDD